MDREEQERQRIYAILNESDSENGMISSESDGDEDHVSCRSHESDTDQNPSDVDSDDTPLAELRRQSPTFPTSATSETQANQVRTLYYYGKDGTKWQKEPLRQNVRTRSENIITQMPGVQLEARNAKFVKECWGIFVNDGIIDSILMYTNARIQTKLAAFQDASKYSYMKECSRSELTAFIGLLYIAGVYRSGRQNLKDLWASDGTGIDIFRLTMSQRRFHFIQSNLCFDDMTTREARKAKDNLSPIRDIFEAFVANCNKAYIPQENLTIDEMLLAFRGRCKFRQYIPSKPAKYGLKIFALVDSKSFYILNLEIYAGKQVEGPYSTSNKPFDVVDRLVKPISKTNRNITFDNWFTSFELVNHLLQEHKLTSVGTIRKNKKQVPAEFLTTRGKDIFSSTFGFQRDLTIVSHIPKKNKVVLLMSSLHHDRSIDESTGEKRKPEINTFYNVTKGGVDVVDELCSTYNVSRNSKKWPLTIFYGILNMSAINGYIIYKKNNNSNMKRRTFLKNLGLDLVREHLHHRKDVAQLPRLTRKRIKDFLGEPDEEPPAKVPNVRKRCQICPAKKDRKTYNTCRNCNKYICIEHALLYCVECANRQTEIEDL